MNSRPEIRDSDPPVRSRAVVCLSGGMDSAVCAMLAARDYEAWALHFSYGQRTEAREYRSFIDICDRIGIMRRMRLRLDLFRRIGGSALTDEALPVPHANAEPEAIGAEIPVTYVPFRNANFLSAAVSWAEILGAPKIMIGAVEQDGSGYPDCRPAFYAAFNELVRQGTKRGTIEVVTPLIRMRKAEIVNLGIGLGAPFDLTWSCYENSELACGACDSCVLRLRAFEAAGLTDPIPYSRRNSGPSSTAG